MIKKKREGNLPKRSRGYKGLIKISPAVIFFEKRNEIRVNIKSTIQRIKNTYARYSCYCRERQLLLIGRVKALSVKVTAVKLVSKYFRHKNPHEIIAHDLRKFMNNIPSIKFLSSDVS